VVMIAARALGSRWCRKNKFRITPPQSFNQNHSNVFKHLENKDLP
jgi:hypothetical protein